MPPASFLTAHRSLLPESGRALDVAVGRGRNAAFLAAEGFEVTGVDRSREALDAARAACPAILVVEADLELEWPVEGLFDLVIVFNYLQRDLFDRLRASLRPGGVLVYETFTTEHTKYRPMRDAFLLRPNELLHAFADVHVMVYREHDLPDEGRAVASLMARC